MKRSHVLNEREIKRVFATIARSAFPARNRAMFMLSIYAGMRVGEIAALRVADVVAAVLAALAGHKNISTTMVYLTANANVMRAAVELI